MTDIDHIKATGVIPEKLQPTRDYEYEVVCGSSGTGQYPEIFELSTDKLGTVKDQGNVGACVGEVMAQLAETFYNIEMSEGYAYGKFRSASSNGWGLTVSTALKFWKELGIVPKGIFDILVEMPDMKKIVNNIPDLDVYAKKYPISGYISLSYADTKKKDKLIKDAITRQANGEINGYGLLGVANNYFGESHCIMITGWNDKKETYRYKNSWGEGFGEKGFGDIPKKELDNVYLIMFDEIKLPFDDVKEGDWFYKNVKNMYFTGMMNGKTETTFDPYGFVTRAELAAVLDRSMGRTDERFAIQNQINNEKLNLVSK